MNVYKSYDIHFDASNPLNFSEMVPVIDMWGIVLRVAFVTY